MYENTLKPGAIPTYQHVPQFNNIFQVRTQNIIWTRCSFSKSFSINATELKCRSMKRILYFKRPWINSRKGRQRKQKRAFNSLSHIDIKTTLIMVNITEYFTNSVLKKPSLFSKKNDEKWYNCYSFLSTKNKRNIRIYDVYQKTLVIMKDFVSAKPCLWQLLWVQCIWGLVERHHRKRSNYRCQWRWSRYRSFRFREKYS